jgi:hypothetical protein
MAIETHHTTICIGPVSYLDPARLTEQPGVDLYRVHGGDVEQQIDHALLEDLHCQRTIVFVGGEQAKREAQAYGVRWIEDTPTVNEDLLRFWRDAVPEVDGP